jgi:hypothetical protein
VGDLRDKARKELQTARIRAMQARRDASTPKPELPRCRCGYSWLDVRFLWAITPDRWKPASYYCPACLPFEYFPIVMMDVANSPVLECEDVQP